MADNYRLINTRFWYDGYVVKLDPLERYLFLYLLTNPVTNIAGVYELPPRRMANETGIDESALRIMLDRFMNDEKIAYVDGWVIVRNFAKHQRLSGPKVESAINAIIEELPDRVSKAYQYPTDTSLFSFPSNSSSIKETTPESKPRSYGDPDINTVVAHFEKTMDTKMPRVASQRRAANTLIKRHGLKNVIGAINFAGTLLGQDKKPQVYTLEDLRDKWKMLEVHAGKSVKQSGEDEKLIQVFN